MPDPLTPADIAHRLATGRRCPLCRNPRRPAGALCWDHHDILARTLDPDYHGDRDLERAASIPVLYARLDPTPTRGDPADRRAPGFASTPPCDLDIVVMRDPRSVGYPVVAVWHELLPGTNQPDLAHPHYEDNHPHRAVPKAVGGLADMLWDDLGYRGPRTARSVEDMCGWLHAHRHALTARDDADDIWRDLTQLHDQLRTAAGDPRPRPVGSCTGWVPAPGGGRDECREPLWLPPPRPGVKIPPSEPVLRCDRCDRPYTHLALLRLEIGAERRPAA